MPRILCTFPGRFGDLLWALPTIRAISEQAHEPVDLQIGGEFASLTPLLKEQPYLNLVVADARWDLREWKAPDPPAGSHYDAIYHLGYRRWPEQVLPLESWVTFVGEYGTLTAPDLLRPWIQPPAPIAGGREVAFAIGFTEAYFELKYGLYSLLMHRFSRRWALDRGPISLCTGGRWRTEAHHDGCTWPTAARWISRAQVVLADCSALHVLAVAMGVPVVLCEPMEARWNPIFYPLGQSGPGVTLVTGNDGKPTFDARHVADALETQL